MWSAFCFCFFSKHFEWMIWIRKTSHLWDWVLTVQLTQKGDMDVKQSRRRRRQKRHGFAYLTIKKHYFCTLCTSVFHFGTFCNRSFPVNEVKLLLLFFFFAVMSTTWARIIFSSNLQTTDTILIPGWRRLQVKIICGIRNSIRSECKMRTVYNTCLT